MPPRYAYWTILVDDQPTAFRAGAQEDLLPTFKRLKEKHPSAVMKWFQNGKLWDSRIDAQEAMRARGEMGRRGDERQQGGFRSRDRDFKSSRPRDDDRKPRRSSSASEGGRPEWKPKDSRPRDPKPSGSSEKLDWKPKGEFTPAPNRSEQAGRHVGANFPVRRSAEREGGSSPGRERKDRREPSGKPDWKPKTSRPQEKLDWKPKGEFTPAPKRSDRADWKPKGSFDRERKPDWKPKGSFDRDRKPDWKSKPKPFDRDRKPDWKSKAKPFDRDRKPEWKPKSAPTEGREPEKRKWVPKEEYKKSQGIEARRDKNWRPGGEHKDPRQKYKDAKKAKWTRFKQSIRKKWEGKKGKP